jgi:hypothetical protein
MQTEIFQGGEFYATQSSILWQKWQNSSFQQYWSINGAISMVIVVVTRIFQARKHLRTFLCPYLPSRDYIVPQNRIIDMVRIPPVQKR